MWIRASANNTSGDVSEPSTSTNEAESSKASSTPSTEGRVVTSPPPGRSFPKGPPVPKGMRLERVERLGEDSWAGVASVDRGDSEALPPTVKTGILVLGDAASLMLFATVGRMNHGEPLGLAAIMGTALPFLTGWLLTAPFLGGYGKEARGGDVGAALGSTAKCWIAAVPVGLVIRSVIRGYVPETPFIIVSMASTAILLGGWRGAIAALTPGEDSQKKRANKRGNPFEFFTLLFSLVKRW